MVLVNEKNELWILREISYKELDSDVKQHHLRLETEAVWLFVAALGCWSVENNYIQLMAYVITLTLFGKAISSGWETKKSFPARLQQIQKQAHAIPGDEKKVLLWDCHNLGKKISLIRSPIHTPAYLSIGLFYLVSFISSLWNLVSG